jgi:hypothetical protein
VPLTQYGKLRLPRDNFLILPFKNEVLKIKGQGMKSLVGKWSKAPRSKKIEILTNLRK